MDDFTRRMLIVAGHKISLHPTGALVTEDELDILVENDWIELDSGYDNPETDFHTRCYTMTEACRHRFEQELLKNHMNRDQLIKKLLQFQQ